MKHPWLMLALCSVGWDHGLASGYYVDPNATGANDGTSWVNAWTNFPATVNLGAGNTLWISGGTTGQTYASRLVLINNAISEAGRVYVKCGQDAGHTGPVTITGGIKLGDESANVANYVTVDGSHNGMTNLFVTKTSIGATIYHRYDNEVGNHYDYLDVTTYATADTQTHCFDLGSYADGTEIDHCYIHNSANRGIREGTGSGAAYGRIAIHDNTFRYNADDPMALDGGVDVYNNIIDGTGCSPAAHPDGLQGVKGGWRIYNNSIHDLTQGIFIETTSETMSNVLVYNNVFYMTQSAYTMPAIILRAKLPNPDTNLVWSGLVIANNTIVGMLMSAFRITVDAGNVLTIQNSFLENNIFSGNAGNTLMNDTGEGTVRWASGEFVWQNNIFNSPTSLNYQGALYADPTALQAAHPEDAGNLTSVPVFVNAASYNYHLSSGSGGIGSGTNLTALFVTDKDGAVRPASGAWDIGAYVYATNLPAVTLTANPSSISPGEFSTLTWSAANSTNQTLLPGIGPVGSSGATNVYPSGTTLYTLTAIGPGGTNSAGAMVIVNAPLPWTARSGAPAIGRKLIGHL